MSHSGHGHHSADVLRPHRYLGHDTAQYSARHFTSVTSALRGAHTVTRRWNQRGQLGTVSGCGVPGEVSGQQHAVQSPRRRRLSRRVSSQQCWPPWVPDGHAHSPAPAQGPDSKAPGSRLLATPPGGGNDPEATHAPHWAPREGAQRPSPGWPGPPLRAALAPVTRNRDGLVFAPKPQNWFCPLPATGFGAFDSASSAVGRAEDEVTAWAEPAPRSSSACGVSSRGSVRGAAGCQRRRSALGAEDAPCSHLVRRDVRAEPRLRAPHPTAALLNVPQGPHFCHSGACFQCRC